MNELEGYLRGELDAARAASSKERVADAYVSGRRERIVAAVLTSGCVGRSDVADEIRQQRTGEVGMVEEVEELGAKLQDHMLGESSVFEDGEVELFKAWSLQRVTSEVAKMAGTGNAVGFVGCAVVPLRISPSAGCCK